MKKLIPIALVASLGFSGIALAEPTVQTAPIEPTTPPTSTLRVSPQGGFVGDVQAGPGGFQGPSSQSATVAQAKQMRDDARVTLKGHIVQSFGDKEYLFKDETGEITVEIGRRQWRGQVITPNDLVEIRGKVDKDWNSIEIDVKEIIKLP